MSPQSQKLFAITVIATIAFIANLPFGYLRQNVRKYSPLWFLYIHISIPLIVALRLSYGIDYPFIPIFVAAAVGGQVVGARLRVPKTPQK